MNDSGTRQALQDKGKMKERY